MCKPFFIWLPDAVMSQFINKNQNMAKKIKRKNIIKRLPPKIKTEVLKLMNSGHSAEEIVEYLKKMGVEVSTSTVCRYKANWKRAAERIQESKVQASIIAEKTAENPDFDLSRALVQMLLSRVADTLMSDEFELDINNCDPVELAKILQSISKTENDIETVKAKFRKEQEERDRKAASEIKQSLKGKGLDEETKILMDAEIDRILMGE